MTDAWRVFNNLLVSLFPVIAAFVGISLLGLVLAILVTVVRRSSS